MKTADLKALETRELFALYAEVLQELRTRKAIRSSNNPVADYAERLAAEALDLELVAKSTAGFDAVDQAGFKYEVKSRRITRHNGSTQISPLRGLDKDHFDFLVGVLFEEDFSLRRACLVPLDVVKESATYRKHVNGWILHLRESLWERPEVRDITQLLRSIILADYRYNEAFTCQRASRAAGERQCVMREQEKV